MIREKGNVCIYWHGLSLGQSLAGEPAGFSRVMVWSAHGHPHGYRWRRGRGIHDELRGPWRLRWNDHHNLRCNGCCSPSDCVRRLSERPKDFRASVVIASAPASRRRNRKAIYGSKFKFLGIRRRYENEDSTQLNSLSCCSVSFGPIASRAGFFQISAL